MIAFTKVIADVLNVDEQAIKAGGRLQDLGQWNSLAHIEVVIALEETYGIQLSQDDIVEMIDIDSMQSVLQRSGVPQSALQI